MFFLFLCEWPTWALTSDIYYSFSLTLSTHHHRSSLLLSSWRLLLLFRRPRVSPSLRLLGSLIALLLLLLSFPLFCNAIDTQKMFVSRNCLLFFIVHWSTVYLFKLICTLFPLELEREKTFILVWRSQSRRKRTSVAVVQWQLKTIQPASQLSRGQAVERNTASEPVVQRTDD